MATIEKFKDIEAWQNARELSKAVYAITADGEFSRDFGLRDQIRSAAVSVLSNIAEGFDRSGNREFMNWLCDTSCLIGGFMRYLKHTEFKGQKHK